jgi:amidase
MTEAIIDMTAVALRDSIRRGDVSAPEVTSAFLARIAERDAEVRAWDHLDPDRALAEARTVEPRSGGLLTGVPVGFKDICNTRDMPTRYGSPIYAEHRPTADANCVRMTRSAGGVALGKAVTTEFAGRDPKKTANPLDPRRTPGGSSSGSAAAVADRQVPLAIGSQTAGSTIRPAAYCGVYAFKPTFGAIPFSGMKNLCARLDTIGLLAGCVEDLALFRCALLGLPEHQPAPSGKGYNLGICRTPYWERASDHVAARFEDACRALASAGHEVREVSYPEHLPDPSTLCWNVINFEMARQLDWEYRSRSASISTWARESIEQGLTRSAEQHEADLIALTKAESAFDALFDAGIDALIAPSAGEEAPDGLADTGPPTFTVPFQVAGTPTVSIPLPQQEGHMPIGLQVIGQRHRDQKLLDIAAALDTSLR